MFTLVLTIHIVLCLAIIGLVLLQQGKGASVGVSFGGGSNTLFGASGAGNVLTKATTTCAVLFMITSLALIKMHAGAGAERSAPSDPLKGSVMERSVTESAQPSSASEAENSAPVAAKNTASEAAAPVAPVQEAAGTSK